MTRPSGARPVSCGAVGHCQARAVARGVPEVGRLSCCAFVFVDETAEDVATVELPHCG